jgi:hypothetical protein
LTGKQFPVLKSRLLRGVECLVLKGSESGTFAMPREWTDLAHPDDYRDADVEPCIFKLEKLIAITELVKSILEKRD